MANGSLMKVESIAAFCIAFHVKNEKSPHWQCETLVLSHTVKPVLRGHLKIEKTNLLMKNGSLMKVEVLQNANTFDLH